MKRTGPHGNACIHVPVDLDLYREREMNTFVRSKISTCTKGIGFNCSMCGTKGENQINAAAKESLDCFWRPTPESGSQNEADTALQGISAG